MSQPEIRGALKCKLPCVAQVRSMAGMTVPLLPRAGRAACKSDPASATIIALAIVTSFSGDFLGIQWQSICSEINAWMQEDQKAVVHYLSSVHVIGAAITPA